jgi:hypothetical protein
MKNTQNKFMLSIQKKPARSAHGSVPDGEGALAGGAGAVVTVVATVQVGVRKT